MWLMKAQAGSPYDEQSGFAFGLPISQGVIITEKQYWFKFLKDRKFKDITPDVIGGHYPKSPKSCLIIRWGGYGDILMVLPVCAELKKMFPFLKITFAGMDAHAQVLRGHPLIDGILIPPAHQIGNLINQYDLVYDLSGIIPSNVESDYKNAYDLHYEWFGINPAKISPEDKVIDFVVTEQEEQEIKDRLEALNVGEDDFVIYFNGESSTQLRNLPPDLVRKTIVGIAKANPTIKVILAIGHSAQTYSRFYCKCGKLQQVSLKGKVTFENMIKHPCECGELIYIVPEGYTGKVQGGGQRTQWFEIPPNVIFMNTNFREMCALINRANVVVTVDSAPLHIAGMLEKPTLGLFSSFDGDLRAKYFKNTTWMQQPFRCAPCFQHNVICDKLRTEEVPFPPCMDSFEPDEIVQRTQEIIDKIKKDPFYEDLGLEKPTPFIPPIENDVSCFACSCKGHAQRSFRKGNFSYWKCENCGSLYTYPRPTLEYLSENYQNPDYNKIFKTLGGIKKLAQLINITFGGRFDFSGKVLEIGANIGWFGAEIKRLGWNYTGVEISKFGVAECRKLGLKKEVIQGSIEDGEVFDQVKDKGLFDLFIIHNTIEHLINPVSLLQTLVSIASEKAVFSISTPCVDMWNGYNTWGHLNPFFAGEHCSLLSKEGMRALASRVGLNVKIIEEFRQSDEIWYQLERIE